MTAENQKALTECFTVMGDAAELAECVGGQIMLDIANTNEMMKCLYDMTAAYTNVMEIARDIYGAELCGRDAEPDNQFLEVNRSKVAEWDDKYRGWDTDYIFPQGGPDAEADNTGSANDWPISPNAETKIGFYEREIERLTGELAIMKMGYDDNCITISEYEDALDNEYNDLFTEYCDLFEKRHGELPPAEQARRAYNAAVQRARALERIQNAKAEDASGDGFVHIPE